MIKWLFVILSICTYISPEICSNGKAHSFQGTYKGEFTRSSPDAKYLRAKVTLTFEEGKFSGESNTIHYPAICNGRYRVIEQEVEFTNECQWEKDFDRSYVLNGKFKFQLDGKKWRLKKDSLDTADEYILTAQ